MTSESEQGSSAEAPKACGCSGGVDQKGGCESCRAQSGGGWVYAIGTIAPRIPSISVEKELAQVIGRTDARGLTDRQALHAALAKPENRYLVRLLCWVLWV